MTNPKLDLKEPPEQSGGSQPECRCAEAAEGQGYGARYIPYSMEDVRAAAASANFTVVSTFAGGGGSSIGYRLAGGRILGVNEFIPEAARTYRKNFPDVVVDTRDIREVLESNPLATFGGLSLRPDELDILDGSPPCSEFSVAGTGIKDPNIRRPYSDKEQGAIATLPFALVQLAHVLQPKIVVCENVPPLATRYRALHDSLLDALRFDNGARRYFVNSGVLTAQDFGVPQARRRLFIIGVRLDVAEAVGVRNDEDVLALYPAQTGGPLTIRAALEGLSQSWKDIEPWLRSAEGSRLGSLIRKLPKRPTKHMRLSDLDPNDRSDFMLRRCSGDRPAPTLVVTGQRPDRLTGCFHPEYDRKFTIPELKRLFGLPDDYILTGTLGQAAERICRMVPPFLTKAIAESLYAKVLRPFKEQNDE